MNWIKSITKINDNIFRVAAIPQDQKDIFPTFAVKNPKKFKPVKTVKEQSFEIYENKFLKISFIQDGRKFSSKNLLAQWQKNEKKYSWYPGKIDTENLGGAYLSLDYAKKEFFPNNNLPYNPMKGIDSYVCNPFMMVRIINKYLKKKLGKAWDDPVWQREIENLVNGRPPEYLDEWHPEILDMLEKIRSFPPGFLSKNGMSIFIDDSLPWNDKEKWIEKLPKEMPQILYFIFYDDDYQKGIKSLTEILGDVPYLPEWAMGIWFSCYRVMGEKEFKKIKQDFDKYNLPLDVVVVDNDWHKSRWHGFDWNEKLFPNPKRFAQWLKKENLHASFNVHPQYIPKDDSRLKEFIDATGASEVYLDKETAPHPLHSDCLSVNLFDKKQAIPYFEIFHKPIEDLGCDMWWIDGTLVDERGRESTTWLNEVYFNNSNKSSDKETQTVISRTFGLGSHRSSIAFTADTFSQWEVLELEVIYTSKAANSLLAYVSHDIGGFIKDLDWEINKPPDELFLRWTQFGCFSPIMRFHSDHGIREPWKFKKSTLNIIRNFLFLRKCLMPYIMKYVNYAHKNGVSICRPLYYHFPNDENAYQYEKQYMLGDAILVSPVTSKDNIKETWIPEGKWSHCFIDRKVIGPTIIKEETPLNILPIYIKEGFELIFYKLAKKNNRYIIDNSKIHKFDFNKGSLAEQIGIL